jgi:hypothetical protein
MQREFAVTQAMTNNVQIVTHNFFFFDFRISMKTAVTKGDPSVGMESVDVEGMGAKHKNI